MSFSADLGKFAAKVGRTLDQTHRAICIKLFSSVVLDTPVDTGALRANWNLSVGEPDESVSPDKRDPGGNATVSRINSFTYPLGSKVYLTNAMPYAEVAEYGGWSGPTDLVTSEGYSRKAPEGMVRKNMARIHRNIAEAVRENKS